MRQFIVESFAWICCCFSWTTGNRVALTPQRHIYGDSIYSQSDSNPALRTEVKHIKQMNEWVIYKWTRQIIDRFRDFRVWQFSLTLM